MIKTFNQYFSAHYYYTIQHHDLERLVQDMFGVEFDYIEDQMLAQRYIVDEESSYDVYDIHWNNAHQFIFESDVYNFESWFYNYVGDRSYGWPITGTILMFLANQGRIPYGHYLIKAY